jgi:hypothetical protein
VDEVSQSMRASFPPDAARKRTPCGKSETSGALPAPLESGKKNFPNPAFSSFVWKS